MILLNRTYPKVNPISIEITHMKTRFRKPFDEQ